MRNSELYFQEKISHLSFSKESLLIVDKNILSLLPVDFLKSFPFTYAVDAGETLKELSQFSNHMNNIMEIWNTSISREHSIVALGGGSVGDFAGFVASVFKRGVKLIHCPSTWLAAIDSAHGGKTALNVQGFKNQIGTFYAAEKVFIFKELLLQQPAERAVEGLGELVKMSLLEHPSFLFELVEEPNKTSEEILWQHLEKAIQAKYKIVQQDPYETKGLRKILNFGHTLGHVLEGHFKTPHGESVLQGLFFALEWSHQRGDLSSSTYERILAVFKELKLTSWLTSKTYQAIPQKTAVEFLSKDKKINSDASMDFIFIRDLGDVFVQKASVGEILSEALRQGWCQP